jgi:hypothetical protein
MDRRFLTLTGLLSALMFGTVWLMMSPDIGKRLTYYPNCKIAWQLGKAPIKRSEAGYREALDGDHDGIACEPYRYRYGPAQSRRG